MISLQTIVSPECEYVSSPFISIPCIHCWLSYQISGYDVRVADVLFIIENDELTSHRYGFNTHKMYLLFFSVSAYKINALVYRIRSQLINVYFPLLSEWAKKNMIESIGTRSQPTKLITIHNELRIRLEFFDI